MREFSTGSPKVAHQRVISIGSFFIPLSGVALQVVGSGTVGVW
jgi:hypothetical protein